MRPASTYRLQIRESFDLDAAAAVTGYLRDLGTSWAYLSPLLTATEGSDHGYDVVDPTRVDPARGGAEGLERFAAAARPAGLGIVVDIVPNHMGVATPEQNAWWWDVLAHGRGSRYAEAFDIDWDAGDGRLILPMLGAPLSEAIGDIRIEPAGSADSGDSGSSGVSGGAGVLRYFDHVLPLAPGSVPPAADLSEVRTVQAVVDRQHYDLRFWRDEASDLNYRRFFTVTTLAGLRVEVPWVFDESHVEILRWLREGLADGLRVDHPDGLLDPGAYFAQLAAAAAAARAAGRPRAEGEDAAPWVVVEKILEYGEHLPGWWEVDGTTGYDALAEIDRVLIDPAGQEPLDGLHARLRAETGLAPALAWHDLIHDTKRAITDTAQVAEIHRLGRVLHRDSPVEAAEHPHAEDALAELLACFPVYRSYLPAGREHLIAAAAEASARRPDLSATITALVPLLADEDSELAQRFQQTTGPVMAKGVEDTAFYRYTRLGSLTEVGGDPSVFALSVAQFHDAQASRQASWPFAMTTLTTHDTKRSEDVRARLDVLAEVPERWAEVLDAARRRATTGNGPFDSLLYQAIVGSWPASRERLHAYAEKAAREAAEETGWLDPDEAFEARMHAVIDAVFDDAVLQTLLAVFVEEITPAGWSNSLSAKLLQLTGPGVPDLYQGSELWETSLVDPDNRRPVDFAERARMLAQLDAGFARGDLPPVDVSGAAKLLVVSRALRLRRDRPDLFSRYTPMTAVGTASDHVVAFDRGGALTVATRLPVGLAAAGGWGDTMLLRHSGPTTDALTGRRFEGSTIALSDLLATYPVALLVPVTR